MNEATKKEVNDRADRIVKLIERRKKLLSQLSEAKAGIAPNYQLMVYVGKNNGSLLKVEGNRFGQAAGALRDAMIGAIVQNIETDIEEIDAVITSMEAHIG